MATSNVPPPSAHRQRWHKISFALMLAVLLLVLALLPFALISLLGYMFRPQSNRIYELFDPSVPAASTHVRLHLDMITLDEWSRNLQIRVAGSHVCESDCPWMDRVVFVASPESGDLAEGLPPSETVDFPGGGKRVTQVITLPVVGQPILFPFDSYRLGLGILFERVLPGGSVQTVSPNDTPGHIYVSLQTHVVRVEMDPPDTEAPSSLGLDAPDTSYVDVASIRFERPVHLKVLTVLLVLLVIVAAMYAVFLRPLAELVINAGALVLGVWGIRSILLGTSPPGATLVDLVLSMVILFLLVAIVSRALLFHRREGHLLLRKKPEPAPPDDPPSS